MLRAVLSALPGQWLLFLLLVHLIISCVGIWVSTSADELSLTTLRVNNDYKESVMGVQELTLTDEVFAAV